ncbi:hypothetical protein JMJ35_009451 [Cladonia borealis]|uniref:Mitochondrial escape protein 2 n=1 Tax=Cladonia borealis TaxID=184061 RepID=A0AA39QSF1_9LECA|nr:hypothetical protein JMJ35_009451 [Cladonia borealis]
MLGFPKAFSRPLGQGCIFGSRNRALWTATRYRPLRKHPWPVDVCSRRYKTTEAGDNKSGHIEAGQNEGIFFLDNVFPLKLNFTMWLPFIDAEKFVPRMMKRLKIPNHAAADPENIAERALPRSLPIQVTEILPRVGEGGAFVKVSHNPEQPLPDLEKTIKKYLKENPIKPWFNPFQRVRTSLVRGRPWVEDLHRVPSARLRVEFVPCSPGQSAEELSQETLYSLFRRYGKLADIQPQPTDSKELPKYALLQFSKVRHAIMAKNCMHGFVLPASEGGGVTGTKLKLGYMRTRKPHWILDWLASHPRVTLPLLLALFGTVTVAIFDPIRTFFVKAHVTRTFHISDNTVYKWLRSQASRATDALKFGRHKPEDAGLSAIWDDRKDDIGQIQTWLMESADTFIVIQGPRGSGKKELVLDQALKGRKNTLVIDCKPIQEAKGDSRTICAAADEVGYRPVFSWMNSISSLIDLAAQGTIGTKTGFSETLDAQLAKIWQNTATALRQIALSERKKDDKDSDLGDDEYLEAHPERRPVVVIDNFLHKSQENSVVYDKISEWAAGLTSANVAHVIFLTNDVSFSKSLSKALPDRVFRQIALGDCSPEVAKRFVINHLDADADEGGGPEKKPKPSEMREDLAELDDCISTLGGRLTDLEFLARRIKTGETPKKAVQEIKEQAASEILKMYILDSSPRKWTPEQAWLLVKQLADSESLRYNELLLSDIFKSDGEGVLQSLEQAEMITIVSSNGRPTSIKPGKPVYSAAFKQLTEDHVLKARLDLAILSQLIKVETQGIDKYEAELNLLANLPGAPKETRGRAKWLLGKLWTSQNKVEGYERESAGLKKVLMQEY